MLQEPQKLQVSHFLTPTGEANPAERTVIEVAGEIHLPNAGQLEEALQPILSNHAGCVLLDFRQVAFVDSAALKVILRTRKLLSLQSRSLTLCLQKGSQPDQATRNSGLHSIIPLIYEH